MTTIKMKSNLRTILKGLSAAELELLLLTSYYRKFLKVPKTQPQAEISAKKTIEYNNLLQVYKRESINKVTSVYERFHSDYPDFFEIIYDFCHNSRKYKNMLMLI